MMGPLMPANRPDPVGGLPRFPVMNNEGRASIGFTLNGHRYELVREDVESRLADVTPDVIRKHAVRIDGTWFPVIQAFGVATGNPRSEFMSNTARRHLAALGYEVAGNDVEPRTAQPAARPAIASSPVPAILRDVNEPFEFGGEWHTEANVQAALVTALTVDGWRILSVATTAAKEHGIDVIASRDGQTAGVEVKGYPSRGYANPARAGDVKRTSPSTQAGRWHSQAVLLRRVYGARGRSGAASLLCPTSRATRDLHAETAGSLAAAQTEVWWVDQAGAVHRP